VTLVGSELLRRLKHAKASPDRPARSRTWAPCHPPWPQIDIPTSQVRYLLGSTFRKLDANGDGVLAPAELAAGLSVFAAGKQSDRVKAAFALFDANHDGFISPDEMHAMLLAVFRAISARDGFDVQEALLERVANSTTEAAFREADVDGNNRLSMDEFTRWYSSGAAPTSLHDEDDEEEAVVEEDDDGNDDEQEQGEGVDEHDFAGNDDDDDDGMFARPSGAPPRSDSASSSASDLAIRGAATYFGLPRRTVREVSSVFEEYGSDAMGLDDFTAIMSVFAPESAPERFVRSAAKILFLLFDLNSDGVISAAELASGLGACCIGTMDDRLRSAFRLFDSDHDGFINLGELARYLFSMFSGAPAAGAVLDDSLVGQERQRALWRMAQATAKELFQEAELDPADPSAGLDFQGFSAVAQAVVSSLQDLAEPSRGKDEEEEPAGPSKVVVSPPPSKKPSPDMATPDPRPPVGREEQQVGHSQHLVDLRQLCDQVGLDIELLGRKLITAARDHARANGLPLSSLLISKTLFASTVADAVAGTAKKGGARLSSAATAAARLASALFDSLDFGRAGQVDARELAAGLSVVSAGEQWDRLRIVFDAFDTDQDGSLSGDELFRGILPVIATSIAADDSSASAEGVFSEARRQAAFLVHDLFRSEKLGPRDLLSFNVFVKWFLGDDAPSASETVDVRPMAAVVAAPPTMAEIEALFDLSEADAGVLIDKARSMADLTRASTARDVARPALSRAAFLAFVRGHQRPHIQEDERLVQRAETVAARLFDALDVDGNACVDVAEIAAGLTLLCSGALETKAEAVLDLMDLDGNGLVSKAEMMSYLTSLLRIVSETFGPGEVDLSSIPGLEFFNAGGPVADGEVVSAASISEAMVRKCFETADTDHDGYLSRSEFLSWFQESGASTAIPGLDGPSASSPRSHDVPVDWDRPASSHRHESSTPGFLAPAQPSVSSAFAREHLEKAVESLRHDSGLGSCKPGDVAAALSRSASEDGTLAREAFVKALSTLMDQASSRGGVSARGDYHELASVLFDVWDRNQDDSIDFLEAAAGITLLCGGGTPQERMAAAFELFDVNQDGAVDAKEMNVIMTAVFRLLEAIHPEAFVSLAGHHGPHSLAVETTREAFENCDVNHDGKLSLSEFQRWFLTSFSGGGSAIPAAVAEEVVMANTSIQEHTDALGPAPLLRTRLGLDKASISDVLPVFAAEARGGRLDPEAFARGIVATLHHLVRLGRIFFEQMVSIADDAGNLFEELFSVFDTDGNGFVDLQELSAGLGVLCGADSSDAKIASIFRLYDLDQDGFITQEELEAVLGSVFRVLELETGGAGMEDYSPEELARETAKAAINAADRNKDGRLSLEEFTHWVSRGGNASDPSVAAAASVAAVGNALQQEPEGLEQLARECGLWECDPVEIMHALARETREEDGVISLEAFARAIHRVSKTSSPQHIEVLFSLFDPLRTGEADFQEVASGLAQLCGDGEADDGNEADVALQQARTAFSLFDLNHDGVLAPEELQTFLASVIAVSALGSHDSRSLTKQQAETLASAAKAAAATATRRCFQEIRRPWEKQLISETEFATWMADAGIRSEQHNATVALLNAAARAAKAETKPTAFDRLRSHTFLRFFEVDEVRETFLSRADLMGRLSREAFDEVIEHFLDARGRSDAMAHTRLKSLLFEAFDGNVDGFVDANELVVALTHLCGSSQDEKLRVAFEVMNSGASGRVTRGEMRRFLKGSLTVHDAQRLAEDLPSLVDVARGASSSPGRQGFSARRHAMIEQVASDATDQCFHEAGADGSGKRGQRDSDWMSLEAFEKWCEKHENESGSLVHGILVATTMEPGMVSATQLQRASGLDRVSPGQVLEQCAALGLRAGSPLVQGECVALVEELASVAASPNSVLAIRRRAILVNHLLRSFEGLPMASLVSLLILLCGSPDAASADESDEESSSPLVQSKARALFTLFTRSGEESALSLDSLEWLLSTLLQVACVLDLKVRALFAKRKTSVFGKAAALKVMRDFGAAADSTGHGGVLTETEFAEWMVRRGVESLIGFAEGMIVGAEALATQHRHRDGEGSASPPAPRSAPPPSAPPADSFKELLESLVGMPTLAFGDVVEAFREAAVGAPPHLSRDRAVRVMNNLSRLGGTTADLRSMSSIFDAWDLDHDGRVSMLELALGLIALAPSPSHAALCIFSLFDRPRSGSLDAAKMGALLHAMRKAAAPGSLESLEGFVERAQVLLDRAGASRGFSPSQFIAWWSQLPGVN
jgi:Ca2+-binding EF-hand superfamily protein